MRKHFYVIVHSIVDMFSKHITDLHMYLSHDLYTTT